MVEYFLMGVLAPVLLNLLHMCIGIYVCVARGSVMSLAFSGAGFFTKISEFKASKGSQFGRNAVFYLSSKNTITVT